MTRVGVALLAGMFALASGTGEAARRTKTHATKSELAKRKKLKKQRAKHRSRRKHGRKVAANMRWSKEQHLPKGFAWPPNKLMKKANAACEDNLDGLGLVWEHATPEGKTVDPIYVPGMEIGGIKYTPAYGKGRRRLSCQLVQELAAIGPDLYALGVREIRFGSIYRNTNVRVHGTRKPFLSRHALGIAMDIKAFVDESGRVANVELEYLKGDPLLHGIEDMVNRSHRFRIVLTPGNDPLSHYDHFHIEAAVDFTEFR